MKVYFYFQSFTRDIIDIHISHNYYKQYEWKRLFINYRFILFGFGFGGNFEWSWK